jgi:hypothetical protein
MGVLTTTRCTPRAIVNECCLNEQHLLHDYCRLCNILYRADVRAHGDHWKVVVGVIVANVANQCQRKPHRFLLFVH